MKKLFNWFNPNKEKKWKEDCITLEISNKGRYSVRVNDRTEFSTFNKDDAIFHFDKLIEMIQLKRNGIKTTWRVIRKSYIQDDMVIPVSL